MRMGIDQAGQHDLAGDVDDFAGAGRQDVGLNAATLPPRMATSFSRPRRTRGSMTRPPRNNRSNEVLTDMIGSLIKSVTASAGIHELRSMLRSFPFSNARTYAMAAENAGRAGSK